MHPQLPWHAAAAETVAVIHELAVLLELLASACLSARNLKEKEKASREKRGEDVLGLSARTLKERRKLAEKRGENTFYVYLLGFSKRRRKLAMTLLPRTCSV